MIRANTPHRHRVVRRVHVRAVARRRRLCRHEVPPWCVLGVLADDVADYDAPIGGEINFPDGRLIVIAQLCPRHVLTVPVRHSEDPADWVA